MAIVGRDEQRAAIGSLLSARTGGLMLMGEPGIGKTVLWETGVRQAQTEGWRVLSHRSVQTEAGLAFTGLSDLVAPVFDEIADALVTPRRRALEVALLLAEPGDTPPDTRLLGLALLDVLRALTSDETPVLVALDDAQWLDASSRAVIGIALRRLRDDPVVSLMTRRTSGGPGDDWPSPEHFDRIVLPPLNLAETDRLVRDGAGYELSRRRLETIQSTSGGNPFFAIELARAGTDSDTGVPPSLRDVLGGRLEQLPRSTQDVLLDAAALGRPTVGLLAPDLEALDVAVVEGIVQIDGSAVRFTHPLLASIAYDRSPPGKRRAVHARLAERVTDPEERARHRSLAAAEAADAGLASELDQASSRAAARGAPAAAAELMEMAVRHTPLEDAEARRARRGAAARFHRVSGNTDRAAELCGELIRELPAGQIRAELLYESALSEHADSSAAIALCRQTLAELDGDDALASRALGYIAINRWLIGDVRGGLEDARASLASAERDGDPVVVATAIARVSQLETWTLEVTPGQLERGVEIERALPELLWIDDSPSWVQAVTLTLNDALVEARAVLDGLVASAERRGDEISRGMHLIAALILDRHQGHLDRALEYAEAAFEHAERFGDAVRPSAYGFGAQVLADLGRDEQAISTIDRGLQLVDPLDEDRRSLLLGARGRLALSRRDLVTARAALDGLVERALRAGVLIPGARPWPETVETFIGLGELERAGDLLATFEELAERSSRWARATSARSRGLLLLAHGDDDGAVAAMERSLDEEGGTYPLERGRTLLALGVVHRHARRSRLAREALEAARDIFESIGAAAWSENATYELARISGRRSHGDGLTPAELRVAELAAQGRQNKEIADTLFLTVGTVEMHLSRTYRKLRVRSRTELANALARSDSP